MYCLATAACKQNSAVASAAAASGGSTANATVALRLCSQPRVLSQQSFSRTRGSSLFAPLHKALTVTEHVICDFAHVSSSPHPLQFTPICWIFPVFRCIIKCLIVLSTT